MITLISITNSLGNSPISKAIDSFWCLVSVETITLIIFGRIQFGPTHATDNHNGAKNLQYPFQKTYSVCKAKIDVKLSFKANVLGFLYTIIEKNEAVCE